MLQAIETTESQVNKANKAHKELIANWLEANPQIESLMMGGVVFKYYIKTGWGVRYILPLENLDSTTHARNQWDGKLDTPIKEKATLRLVSKGQYELAE